MLSGENVSQELSALFSLKVLLNDRQEPGLLDINNALCYASIPKLWGRPAFPTKPPGFIRHRLKNVTRASTQTL
jgi:hypothetical protein